MSKDDWPVKTFHVERSGLLGADRFQQGQRESKESEWGLEGPQVELISEVGVG